jgi:hypothetical protein
LPLALVPQRQESKVEVTERLFTYRCDNPGQTPPVCSKGHGPMMLVEVEQGDRSLGFLWFCVNNDNSKSGYCDECEDYVPEPMQLEMGL